MQLNFAITLAPAGKILSHSVPPEYTHVVYCTASSICANFMCQPTNRVVHFAKFNSTIHLIFCKRKRIGVCVEHTLNDAVSFMFGRNKKKN